MKRLFAVSFVALLSACNSSSSDNGGSGAGAAGGASGLTYYADVKPIVDAKCATCHQPGDIGPFPLQTYDQVVDNAAVMSASISADIMPPWPPEKSCNTYKHTRALSDTQKTTLKTWLDGDHKEGDPKDFVALDNGSDPAITFDTNMAMSESYSPKGSAAHRHDDYRCFVLDWTPKTNKFITALDFTPGRRDLVHHVVLYQADATNAPLFKQMDDADDGAGYTCFGGATSGKIDAQFKLVGGWAPGTRATAFPEGTGILVKPGSKLIMQLHYNLENAAADAGSDTTTFKVRTADSVTKSAYSEFFLDRNWLAPGGMPIPAGQADVLHSYGLDLSSTMLFGSPYKLYQVLPHMHELGKTISLKVKRADSSEECVVDIADWDFHWQGFYELAEPITIYKGDELKLECHWNNKSRADGKAPFDVEWGEGTEDEMCLAGIYFTLGK